MNSKHGLRFYLLLFSFFCLSFGQLGRITILNSSVNIYFHDIFLIAYVLIESLALIRNRKIRVFAQKNLKPFIPLIITGMISFIGFHGYSFFQNFVGLAYLIRLIVLFLFFGFIMNERQETVKNNALLVSVLILIFSYVQYFLFPNFWSLYYLGWDPHMFRAVGTFFDPTTSGTIFLLLMLSCFMFYKKVKNRLLLIIAILFIPLIFLTYSRITYLAFLVSVIYYMILMKKFPYIIAGLLIFSSILIMLPRPEGAGVRLERLFSIKSRIVANNVGISLFIKNPLLGVGYNRIKFARQQFQSKSEGNASSGFPSSFITVLSSMGIIGLAGFTYIFITLWRKALDEQKVLILGFLTSSLLENVFFVSLVFIIFSLGFSLFKVRSGQ